MSFSLKMFDSKVNVAVVESGGVGSIVPHSHEFVETVYVKSGHGEHIIGDKHVKIEKGNLFVIADKSVVHSIIPLGNADEFTILNIIFPYEFYRFNYYLLKPEHVYHVKDIPNGEALIERIRAEYSEKKWLYGEMTHALTQMLMSEIFRLTPTKRRKPERDGSTQKQNVDYIDTAMKFIHSHYDSQIDVDDVASACGVCKSYIQRLFRKERDTSIKEYLIKYRIEQSCKYLINTDYSVAVVSEMVGFNDIKYFYMKFKEIVGMTPIQYKQSQGGRTK